MQQQEKLNLHKIADTILNVLLTGDIGYRVIFEMIYDKALYDFSNLDMSSVMKT